jgi:hypothetical protein
MVEGALQVKLAGVPRHRIIGVLGAHFVDALDELQVYR